MTKSIVPTSERIVQPARVGRFVEREFATVDPSALRSVLGQADRATKLEVFADLAEWILEDDRVSAVVDTRIDAVSSVPFRLEPGRALPGKESIAQKAADDCRSMLESTDRLTMVFEELLHSYWIGYSGSEHMWERDGGWWVTRPQSIRARDVSFSENWRPLFRSYEYQGNKETWIDPAKFPGKFITFLMRRRGSTPMRSGLIRNVAFLWLAKRWALKFWLAGAERLAVPPMIGRVNRTTNATARTALREGLINLTDGQAAILEEETNIEFPDTKFATSADVWEKLVSKLDAAITIAALGSLDNTESGSGSFARAESQAEVNLAPRNAKLAYLMFEVVERDWLAPFLELNAEKYGGVIPPTPRLVLATDEAKMSSPIYAYHMDAGVVTKNEVRAQLGLDPIDGGDALIEPVTAPSDTSGGTSTEFPLAKGRPRTAMLSTKPRTSGTFFDLRTISERAPVGTSVGPVDSLHKPQSTAPRSSTISPQKSPRVSARRKASPTRKS